MSSAATVALPRTAGFMARSSRPALRIDPTPATSAPQIPKIVITPPDASAEYSTPVPEQQYEKAVLFVPVRTEELGWDEHGLYWNGTYAYPVHEIYDKEGLPIGRRRKGPAGYRFEEYYEGKKARRTSGEEARVRLEEPAPARIEARKVTKSVEEEVEEMDVDEELVETPTSPTMSEATETEDGGSSFGGDDSASLWSRNEDAESECTSPGVMSPPSLDEADIESFAPEKLSSKLTSLDSNKASKNTWLNLGTLPSSSSSTSAAASSSRSQSLPTSLELSTSHRSTSTPITESQHREGRRHSSPSAYSSIIDDLITSPFASTSSGSAAVPAGKSAKTPFRSATLPRSTSRSASKLGQGSVLRAPPASSTSSLGRRSSTNSGSSRRSWGSGEEFSAGWQFESQTAALSCLWDRAFGDHY